MDKKVIKEIHSTTGLLEYPGPEVTDMEIFIPKGQGIVVEPAEVHKVYWEDHSMKIRTGSSIGIDKYGNFAELRRVTTKIRREYIIVYSPKQVIRHVPKEKGPKKVSRDVVNGIYGTADGTPHLHIEKGWVVNGAWDVWIPKDSDGTIVRCPYDKDDIHFLCSIQSLKDNTDFNDWKSDYNYVLFRARQLLEDGTVKSAVLTGEKPFPHDTSSWEPSEEEMEEWDLMNYESVDDIPF